MSTAALVKDCKVVLEDISSCDAVKLKMLITCQENTHTASSHVTKEKKLLEGFSVKTAIAWGKANDERWVQLDDIVYSKLKNYNSLTDGWTFCKPLFIKRQPIYLATPIHLKEIWPDEAGGLNCPFSSLKKNIG